MFHLSSTFSQRAAAGLRFWPGLVSLLILLLASTSAGAQATSAQQGFFNNYFVVSKNGTSTFYKTAFANPNDPNNGSYQNAPLGTFDRNTDQLTLGGELNTYEATGTVLFQPQPTPAVTLYYRVYPQGTPAGGFTTVTINQSSTSVDPANPTSLNRQYQALQASADILSSLPLGRGNYTLEVYAQATYAFNNTNYDIFDNNGSIANYTANFTVTTAATTPAGQNSQWISNRGPNGVPINAQSSLGVNEDWLEAGNWSNGVPNPNSDALIPDHATGTVSTAAPNLYDPNATYEVRNLNMPNPSQNDRSVLRLGNSTTGNLSGGTLRVYGNLNCPGAGILASVSGTNNVANPATNSTLVLLGNVTQNITGGVTVADIRIEGTGDKHLSGFMNATNTLTLPANTTQNITGGATINAANTFIGGTGDKKLNGFLNCDNTLTFVAGTTARLMTVDGNGNLVAAQTVAFVDLGVSGSVIGETNTAYVVGTLQAQRNLQNGVKQTFGNVGVDITPNRNITAPANDAVRITRATGPGQNFSNSTPTTTVGITRIYGVSGDVNNNTTSTVVFHYLDSDGTGTVHTPADNELNGTPEANLVVFRTANGNSGPFVQIASTLDATANTLTITGITAINTITAGNSAAPLPVNLTKFAAVRNEANALLTWATASETNNKGFSVQVSTDGVNFRDLAFVASQQSNSLTVLNYSYIDKEAGKTGKRYYRLLQTDLDGKGTYSLVNVVNFDGKGNTTTLAAYPNPFTDALSLTIDGGSAVHVKLVDTTGRLVQEQDIAGDSNPSISGLSGLNAGIYLAKVTMADGSTQNLRIQKQ